MFINPITRIHIPLMFGIPFMMVGWPWPISYLLTCFNHILDIYGRFLNLGVPQVTMGFRFASVHHSWPMKPWSATGGNGYVDDSPIARLFRQAPLNAIWEGSGNVSPAWMWCKVDMFFLVNLQVRWLASIGHIFSLYLHNSITHYISTYIIYIYNI